MRSDRAGVLDGGLVSADAHVNEPRGLWKDNLPQELRAAAMEGLRAGDDGHWEPLFEGAAIDQTSVHEEDRLKVCDPDYRLSVMRQEGIAAECVFPTIGLYVWTLTDPAGGAASCRIYNEWIAGSLGGSPRFSCAGLVPTWTTADALTEIQWIADHGLGSIMLPVVAAPEWNSPTWEPVWTLIAETGLPVVLHQGTGHSMFFYRGLGAGVANLVATQTLGARTAALLATSGVLERHPALQVIFVEFNGGWLAGLMQTVDYYTEAFGRYGRTPSGKPWVNPALSEPPSYYLRRQIHATFQDDPVGIHNLLLTGDQALLWGSDFPHEEGTYPHSREVVARLAAGMNPRASTPGLSRLGSGALSLR